MLQLKASTHKILNLDTGLNKAIPIILVMKNGDLIRALSLEMEDKHIGKIIKNLIKGELDEVQNSK